MGKKINSSKATALTINDRPRLSSIYNLTNPSPTGRTGWAAFTMMGQETTAGSDGELVLGVPMGRAHGSRNWSLISCAPR